MSGDRLAHIEVVVSEFCEPGKAFIVNTELLGGELGGKLFAFHPDQRHVAERVEEVIARDASLLKAHAAMLSLARLDRSSSDRRADSGATEGDA